MARTGIFAALAALALAASVQAQMMAPPMIGGGYYRGMGFSSAPVTYGSYGGYTRSPVIYGGPSMTYGTSPMVYGGTTVPVSYGTYPTSTLGMAGPVYSSGYPTTMGSGVVYGGTYPTTTVGTGMVYGTGYPTNTVGTGMVYGSTYPTTGMVYGGTGYGPTMYGTTGTGYYSQPVVTSGRRGGRFMRRGGTATPYASGGNVYYVR